MFEIVSFPSITNYSKSPGESCEKVAGEFTQLLREIHKLVGENTCIELLWITEKAQNQTFTSKTGFLI